MNEAIELYLNRATRGLWGRKRNEVKEELFAHVKSRVTAHQIAGLNETDAVKKALQELGNPREVSSEMTKLYTLPTIVGLGSFLAAICTVTAIIVSSTLAQSLKTTHQFPSVACLEGIIKTTDKATMDEICNFNEGDIWTSIDSLKEVLEPQGVTISSAPNSLKLDFPGEPSIAFARENYVAAGDASEIFNGPYDGEKVEQYIENFNNDYALAEGYLPLWEVLSAIIEQSVRPLRFSGWANPSLQLGEIALKLGNSNESIRGDSLYVPYLAEVTKEIISSSIPNYLFSSPLYALGIDYEHKRIPIEGEAGSVYGVITVTEPYLGGWSHIPLEQRKPGETGFLLDVAPLSQNGSLIFELPTESVVPAQSIRHVESFGNRPQIGDRMLVRLTGQASKNGFGYEVVPPEQIRLESP